MGWWGGRCLELLRLAAGRLDAAGDIAAATLARDDTIEVVSCARSELDIPCP